LLVILYGLDAHFFNGYYYRGFAGMLASIARSFR